jgi:hypothetical protein
MSFMLAGCSLPASDGQFVERLPDRSSFPEVAQVLVRHCGTLDCHGQRGRNLILYGNEGLRWASTDRPLEPPCTTADEFAHDFESVVGLEPEVMSAVVANAGAQPTRLTLVRKALGLESHEGGAPFRQGDDGDTCLTSWLAAETQTDACLRALPPTTCFAPP